MLNVACSRQEGARTRGQLRSYDVMVLGAYSLSPQALFCSRVCSLTMLGDRMQKRLQCHNACLEAGSSFAALLFLS